MGFWQTGYMEFHEPTGEGFGVPVEPPPPRFLCETCGLLFLSLQDLGLHNFRGHTTHRPVLLYGGRECGRGRLTIHSQTKPDDWAIRCADTATINGVSTSVAVVPEFLAERGSGVFDVRLANRGVAQDFQFEFAFADHADLDGVDAALGRLIDGGELSVRAIDDLIMRSKGFPSASRYLSGLADYLYGVVYREGAAEEDTSGGLFQSGYEAKYDKAVAILGNFDRPPAEAICGIVAFHYNQFAHAMTKTKSQRVAEVSMRFEAMLKDADWTARDLSSAPHSSLDMALSDSVIEQILSWSALPLDGSAGGEIPALLAGVEQQRPYDAFKLQLVASEHLLAAGNGAAAIRHADWLRHSRISEAWYAGFRRRVRGI